MGQFVMVLQVSGLADRLRTVLHAVDVNNNYDGVVVTSKVNGRFTSSTTYLVRHFVLL